MSWEPVIGLEIHVQLKTESKIFSGAATKFGAEPNTQACAVDLALPGVLPVFNETANRMAIKFGLAIGAEIAERSVFARKNYFYPDLPKGYQISQYELPIVEKGLINVAMPDGTTKPIRITRAHLEEDAGKSVHDVFPGQTGVDLNRAGTPLLEVVTEPDFRSAEEASVFLKTLRGLIRYLEISDGNMQEGSMRCDVNVSVRRRGAEKYGTRAEVKNVNSFRFVEKAIEYEIERQILIIEDGGEIAQETRLFDPSRNETRSMRSKEEATDYRYFPCPDLLPVETTKELIEEVKATIPELPWEKQARFEADYGLNTYNASLLAQSKSSAKYFEDVIEISKAPAKLVANWMGDELAAALNKENLSIAECPISAERFAGLIARIADNTISGKIAKTVFEAMWNEANSTADDIIEKQGLKQITDPAQIKAVVEDIITQNPKQVQQYKGGNERLFGFFVGQTMKATQGKANPQQVNAVLKELLG